MLRIKWILLIILLLLNFGCAIAPQFNVGVNSYVRPEISTYKTYILLSGMNNIDINNLEFIEFSSYVDRALTKKGLIKESNPLKADLLIALTYGIGDPKESSYTSLIPIFGQTGVSSSSTYGNVSLHGSHGSYSETTTYQPKYGVTGYVPVQKSYVSYSRFAYLTAYDLKQYRDNQKEEIVWETRIASVGSSGDLRMVFPIMIGAASAFLATSTGKIININIYEDDSRVLEVKGLPIKLPSSNSSNDDYTP